jgi:hypothetical protein
MTNERDTTPETSNRRGDLVTLRDSTEREGETMPFDSHMFRQQAPGYIRPEVDKDGFPETVPCPLDAVSSGDWSRSENDFPLHWRNSEGTRMKETGVALRALRSIGIGDTRDVSSHLVSHIHDASIAHVIRFRNGGFVKVIYGEDRSVLALEGEFIQAKVSVDGDVVITAWDRNKVT